MHPVLNKAFEACLSELETVDSAGAQLRGHGQAHLPSIQQRVESNLAILRQYRDLLQRRLDKGRLPRGAVRTQLELLVQVMVLGFGYVPPGSPLMDEALLQRNSLGAMSGRELARLLADELTAFDQLLDGCRKRFGMERIEIHPLLGPLRVDQWRRCQALQMDILRREVVSIRRGLSNPVRQRAPRPARA